MRAIIIDDERLARAELKKLLQEFPEVEVVDEAANAEEGITKIESQRPDLIIPGYTDARKNRFRYAIRSRKNTPGHIYDSLR